MNAPAREDGEITKRILDLLKEKHLLQKDLCVSASISESTFSNWVNRNTDPKAKFIIPICEFLGVSTDFLLTGDDSFASSSEDREWLNLIHSLSPETQRDFKGAMRLHADLHEIADRGEQLRQAK